MQVDDSAAEQEVVITDPESAYYGMRGVWIDAGDDGFDPPHAAEAAAAEAAAEGAGGGGAGGRGGGGSGVLEGLAEDLQRGGVQPLTDEESRQLVRREYVAERKERLIDEMDAKQAALDAVRERGIERPVAGMRVEEALAAFPERGEVISGLLGDGETMLLAAARKAGKTTLMLNLARCLSAGEPFLRTYSCSQTRVAWLNFELAGRMLAEWASKVGLGWAGGGGGGGGGVVLWPDREANRRVPLLGKGFQYWVEQLKRDGLEGGAVILDPVHVALGLHRATGANSAGATNDNDLVRRLLDDLTEHFIEPLKLRALVLLDHTAKGGTTAKGAGAKEEWADSIIRLNKVDSGRYFDGETRHAGDVEESKLSFDPETLEMWIEGKHRGLSKAQAAASGALTERDAATSRALYRALKEADEKGRRVTLDELSDLAGVGRDRRRSWLNVHGPEGDGWVKLVPDDTPVIKSGRRVNYIKIDMWPEDLIKSWRSGS